MFLYSLLVFRNTSDFFFFLHVHLMSYRLAGFIVLGVFCFVAESLRFSMKKTVSSVNRNHLMSSFPGCMPFVPPSFFCLTAQARTSSTMLNKNQESRCLCLVPNPRGKAVGYLWCSLSCSRSPFHSCLWEFVFVFFFIMSGY